MLTAQQARQLADDKTITEQLAPVFTRIQYQSERGETHPDFRIGYTEHHCN